MKPIIIYAPMQDGKITLDRAVLEQAIKDAYEQGKADGQPLQTASPYATWTVAQPTNIPNYFDSTTAVPRPLSEGVITACN